MQPTKMGFAEAIKTCFSKAFTFTGRARRSEYWYWALFTFLVSIPFSILAEVVPEEGDFLLLILGVYGAWGLFQAIATFAVTVRRLHDIGRSGWWYGAQIILGFVWTIAMVIWFCAIAYITPIDIEDEASMLAPFIPWLIVCFITLLPYIAYGIVLFVWFCTDSIPGANKYGENPKGVEAVQMCAPDMEEAETIEIEDETKPL